MPPACIHFPWGSQCWGAAGQRALICFTRCLQEWGLRRGPEHTWAARKAAFRSAQSPDGHPLNQPHSGWDASTGPKFKHMKVLFHVPLKSLLTCTRKINMKLRVCPAGQYKSQSPPNAGLTLAHASKAAGLQ